MISFTLQISTAKFQPVPGVYKVVPSHAAHGNARRCRERSGISCGRFVGLRERGSIC
jgi:hypothetical protein